MVGNERVAVNEVIPVLIVPVGLRAVGKVEQGLKIVGLRVINIRKKMDAIFGFGQQAFLDDLGYCFASAGNGELPLLS